MLIIYMNGDVSIVAIRQISMGRKHLFDISAIAQDSLTGYVLEVDLEYSFARWAHWLAILSNT